MSKKIKKSRTKSKKTTSQLRKELRSKSKVLRFVEKEHNKQLQQHEKDKHLEIKTLKFTYEKKINFLNRKHDQDISELNKKYKLEIFNVERQWDKKLQDAEDENEGLSKNHEMSKNKELEKMRLLFLKRQSEISRDYQIKIKKLQDELVGKTQALVSSRHHVTKQKHETQKWKTKYQDQEAINSDLNERMGETSENLHITKQKLSDLKNVHQEQVLGLKKNLQESEVRLKHNVKVIKHLKSDIMEMHKKIVYLQDGRKDMVQKIEVLSGQKQNLKTKAKNFQISSQDLTQQLKDINRIKDSYQNRMQETDKTIEKCKTKLHQSELGMNQIREELRTEKKKHIALRGDYEDRMNKITSLDSSLQKYKEENATVKDILAHIQKKYKALKKKSDQDIQEMIRLTEDKDSYQKDLEDEKEKNRKIKISLQHSREELLTKIQRLETDENRSHNMLEACQAKSQKARNISKSQQKHIDNLETHIRDLVKDVEDNDKNKNRVQQLSKDVNIKGEQLEKMKNNFIKLKHRNKALHDVIENFEGDRQKHKKLRHNHQETLDFLSDLKREHKNLTKNHKDTLSELDKRNKDFRDNEMKVERYASAIKHFSICIIRNVKKKISWPIDSSCQYPFFVFVQAQINLRS